MFSADSLADSSGFDIDDLQPLEFTRPHTFFVRAVDDEGLSSIKPAYRSFTARTLSPEVEITTPIRTGFAPAIMPPFVTFRWFARDFINSLDEVQEPDSMRWILINALRFLGDFDAALDHIRANPNSPDWSKWYHYNAPGDSGRSWTPNPPLAFGNYVLAVQAKDDAGAVTPVFDLDHNVRRVRIDTRLNGPAVSLFNRYIKTLLTSSANTPPVTLDIPAGLPVEFAWTADASSYGGTVTGYRYGWDVIDVNDDSQWEVDFTPFVGSRANSPPRTFFFGAHTFILEVKDNSGFKTRATAVVNVVPFTMERSVLVIDDWEENSRGFTVTRGILPNDREHDAFWVYVLDDVLDFAPSVDMLHLEGAITSVPIHLIAKYKTVIWNAIGSNATSGGSALGEYIKFNDPAFLGPEDKITPNIVELFMEAGGRVLLCGQEIMTTAINRRFAPGVSFPLIFRYELMGDQDGSYQQSIVGVRGVADNSFAYDDCCLDVTDIAYSQNPNARRRPPQGCPVNAVRTYDRRTEGLRACVSVDQQYGFPRLELRPEVANLDRAYHESRRGLVCDIYNPPYFSALCSSLPELSLGRSCFQPMYTLECLDSSSPIFGAPVAFWTTRHATRVASNGVAARSAVWGFEPVYFNPDQVKQALNIILFDEWRLPRTD